jgi:hypothetical protein
LPFLWFLSVRPCPFTSSTTYFKFLKWMLLAKLANALHSLGIGYEIGHKSVGHIGARKAKRLKCFKFSVIPDYCANGRSELAIITAVLQARKSCKT